MADAPGLLLGVIRIQIVRIIKTVELLNSFLSFCLTGSRIFFQLALLFGALTTLTALTLALLNH